MIRYFLLHVRIVRMYDNDENGNRLENFERLQFTLSSNLLIPIELIRDSEKRNEVHFVLLVELYKYVFKLIHIFKSTTKALNIEKN